MTNKNDKRYVCTEDSIRSAFLMLAREGYIEQTSVTDLCKVAGISRNAFYLHYANVPELCSAMIDEVIDDVRTESLGSSGKVLASEELDSTLSLAIIEALAAHEKLLRTVLPADNGVFARRLANGIAEAFVNAALLFGEHGSGLEHTLSCSFSAWGLVGFLQRWITTTEKPLSESIPYYEELQCSISTNATRYLLGAKS